MSPLLFGPKKSLPNAGPIKSQTIGIENRPLQRKLTMSDEYFHQGQAGFASELGCWNECVTEVGEITVHTSWACALLKEDEHGKNERTV